MAISAAGIKARIASALDGFSDWSTRHRFWFESAGVTLFALVALAAVGSTSLARAGDWEEQTRQLMLVEARMDAVARAFQPPDSAESVEWLASEQALLSVAATNTEPLAMAGLIARRAEEVGIGSIGVSLLREAPVTAGRISTGDWSAEPEATVIRAEIVEEIGGAIRFIGVLPPNVEVASVRAEPAGSLVRSVFILVVLSIEGPS